MAITTIEQVDQPTWAHSTGTLYTFDDGWKALVLHPSGGACIAWVRLYSPGQEIEEESYTAQYYLERWSEEGGYPPRATFTETTAETHRYIEALAPLSPELAQLWRATHYDIAARQK